MFFSYMFFIQVCNKNKHVRKGKSDEKALQKKAWITLLEHYRLI